MLKQSLVVISGHRINFKNHPALLERNRNNMPTVKEGDSIHCTEQDVGKTNSNEETNIQAKEVIEVDSMFKIVKSANTVNEVPVSVSWEGKSPQNINS